MTFHFSTRSLAALDGVNPALVAVAHRALELTAIDFVVTEGKRSLERQQMLFNTGASRTMNSRHLSGDAIDIAPWIGGGVRWDWPLFLRLAEVFRDASLDLKTPIRWGGTWQVLGAHPEHFTAAMLHRRFPDGPHFELPR